MAKGSNGTDTEKIENGEVDELRKIVAEQKIIVEQMKPKVDKTYDVLFNEEHDIEQREGIDDLRLMRDIYRRFKSARFIFGAIAGVLTFLATTGWAIYKITTLIMTLIKTKGGG